MSVPAAAVVRFEEIQVGRCAEREYVITAAVQKAFTDAFGDISPIHVDEEQARAAGFPGRVMQGAILNGFLSHFVGMVLPGAAAILLMVDLRYHEPSFQDDRLRIKAEVTGRIEGMRAIELRIIIENVTRDRIAARGRALVKVRDLGSESAAKRRP